MARPADVADAAMGSESDHEISIVSVAQRSAGQPSALKATLARNQRRITDMFSRRETADAEEEPAPPPTNTPASTEMADPPRKRTVEKQKQPHVAKKRKEYENACSALAIVKALKKNESVIAAMTEYGFADVNAFVRYEKV
jgi:hypothetical protein